MLLSACSLYRPPRTPNVAKFPKFTEEDSLLGTLSRNRDCYDVKYYDMDLKIDPQKKMVSGKVVMHFEAKFGIHKMQIDLDPKLDIHSITNEFGDTLEFERKYRAVTLRTKRLIPIGSKSKITIHYSGKPKVAAKPPWKGGLVWDKKDGKWFCGVSCEDDGSSIWWPGKDHISDKPDSIEVTYTIPEGHQCIGNGRLVQHQKTFDGWEKFTWRTSYPINHYNITFYIGDFKHFQIDYNNPGSKLKKLDFYVRPENLNEAKEHFKQSVRILQVYEELFGPYPWWKDGYKLVESPYEGMEHQSAIAYGDEFKNTKYLEYDYIILHETAHEWWGNYVTACDMADLWIHEGFATYSEMLYEEKTEGKDSYHLSYLVNRYTAMNKRPLVGPRNVTYSNWRDNDIYEKGAVVLYMLRKTLANDQLFFMIIKKFATESHDNCVYTEDFMQLVNGMSGQNYDWFFEQYVFRAEAPELLYNYGTYEGKTEFRYKWNTENTNENFKLPIHVEIDGKTYSLVPSSELQKLSLPEQAANEALIDQDDYVVFTNDKKL